MEIREIKDAAKVAADYLNRDGIEVSHAKMLEAFSRGFIGRNWATFRATLKTSSFVLRDAQEDPAVALSDTIKGLMAALEAQEQPESNDGASVGYSTRVYKSQGQTWLEVLAGLQGVEASHAEVAAAQNDEPIFGTGMDFSHVEPGLHTLVAVCDNGKEVQADALVNYHTGQVRLTGALGGIGKRKVLRFYIESIGNDDSVTRYLVNKVGATSHYGFARNQDFCRFQKAFSWLIEAYRPQEQRETILPSSISGRLLVRCADLTESEVPAFLDPITRQVELLTSYPGGDALPEGPYEWAKFLIPRKAVEHVCPAFVDEDGDWFASEWHLRQILKLF